MSTYARHNPDQPEYPREQVFETADYDCATEWEASGR